MFTRVLACVASTCFIVLASCSEGGLLTPLSTQSSQITIGSVASGTMVSNGDQIPISVKLNSSQSTPSDLKVELLSPSGDVVQTADIKNVDFSAPLPSIQLSELKDGAYTMRLTLLGVNGDVLAQQKVNIFYVNGNYSLDGITSYPPTMSPGATGLIVARVTAPQGANPYLRWSMGDKLIANGYLSDGYDKIQWNAPSATGVYSIKVEMFPYGPPPGGSFDFTSPYVMKVEVFVTNAERAGRNELGPKDSYFALYHFEGNLKDSAAHLPSVDLTPLGDPTLSVNGSVFGYQLNGSSGFKASSFLLPLGADGLLAPASITMRVRLDKDQPNRQFFRAETADGSFSLDIETDGQGRLTATVNGTAEARGVVVPTGDVSTITLSLVPVNGSLELLWFVNGNLALSDTLPIDPKVGSPEGTSVIGGSKGFTGLIDEFGVYYQDSQKRASTDPEVYRRAMGEEYGSNLVFAEGFDGIYLPSDLSYDGNVKRDQLINGLLDLSTGQAVTLSKVALGSDTLTVAVAVPGLSDRSTGSFSIASGGKQIYSVALKDGLSSANQFDVELKKTAGGLRITAGGQTATTVSGDFASLSFGVAATGTNALTLRSILVLRSRGSLATHGAASSKTSSPET